MEAKNLNRSRIIGLRLTPKEYEQIVKKWKASTCRKLSDYVRRSIFEKPIVTTYRNQSLDDYMAEMMKLRNELNGIGNNFNQAVKKLHTLHQIAEFRSWIITYELEKKILLNKVGYSTQSEPPVLRQSEPVILRKVSHPCTGRLSV